MFSMASWIIVYSMNKTENENYIILIVSCSEIVQEMPNGNKKARKQ